MVPRAVGSRAGRSTVAAIRSPVGARAFSQGGGARDPTGDAVGRLGRGRRLRGGHRPQEVDVFGQGHAEPRRGADIPRCRARPPIRAHAFSPRVSRELLRYAGSHARAAPVNAATGRPGFTGDGNRPADARPVHSRQGVRTTLCGLANGLHPTHSTFRASSGAFARAYGHHDRLCHLGVLLLVHRGRRAEAGLSATLVLGDHTSFER